MALRALNRGNRRLGQPKRLGNELFEESEESVAELSESVTRLVEQFAKLPGIGKKSAERLAYHILRVTEAEAVGLADAIRQVKQNVRYCKNCYNLSEEEECGICRDARRDRSLLCVVEQPRDLLAIEQTGDRGLYHVLLGRIAPLEGIGPEQLTIEPLVRRVREGEFREVIMGTNPTLDGDGTALAISHRLAELPVAITRLARGITTGSVLEFANKEILSDALAGRQKF